MSTSKARFQPNSTAGSNAAKNPTPKSTAVSGAVSKRAGGGNPNASGFVGGPNKSGHVQVIFNGKILTPQSLIPRKTGSHGHGHGGIDVHKKLHGIKSGVGAIQPIDENASDGTDKEKGATAFPSGSRLKRSESISDNNQPSSHSFAQKKLSGGLVGKGKSVVEEMCTVVLAESETQVLLSFPSLVQASDTRDIIQVDERNARYEAVVKSHSNVDGFASRPTQTMNLPQKNQNEMAAPNALRDMGAQVSAFDITDAVGGLSTSTTEGDAAAVVAGIGVGTDGDEVEGLNPSVRKFIADTVGVAVVTPGCLLDTKNVQRPLSHAEITAQHQHRGKGGKSGTSRSQAGTSKSGHGSVTHASTGGASGEDFGQGTGSGFFGPGEGGKSDPNATAGLAGTSGTDVVGGGHHHHSGNSGDHNNAGNRLPFSNAAGGTSASGAVAGGGDSNTGDDASQGQQSLQSDGGGSQGGQSFTAEDSEAIMREAQIERIMSSNLLLKRLHMVERAIQQNANHRAQLDYRDLPDIAPLSLISSDRTKTNTMADQLFGGNALGGGKGGLNFAAAAMGATKGLGDGADGAGGDGELTAAEKAQKMLDELNDKDRKVKKLFSYSNVDLIQDRPVTAMVWNAVSSDLLAVGYGKTEVFEDLYHPGEALDEEAQGGLVLFWSLRNPDYPEKILRTPHPVTALDFSKQNPMVLAVGLLNGDVNVYDVRREGAHWSVPVESSKGMTGGHSDPVWQLKWIVKGAERLETLISISTDGRVLEWNLKKGLLVSTLMQLKKSGTGEGWISNTAAGLSLDFHPSDTSTYVTGTEDGSIHRCSVSYNEQYLDSYQGHEGPVYRIKFSPRWPSMFLSCSADWSMNLYHIKFKNPMLSMRATGENFPITDISWCPDNSTVFACVTTDAKLQIWDLSVSSIDPVVTLDTSLEDRAGTTAGEAEEPEAGEDIDALDGTAAGTGLLGARYTDRLDGMGGGEGESHGGANATPMAKLLKNLNGESKKKSLTTVLFGEKNPSVVVGDSKGTVTVYRVFDPVTITHLGPLQQYEKLKKVVLRQTDPASAASLETADNGEEEKM